MLSTKFTERKRGRKRKKERKKEKKKEKERKRKIDSVMSVVVGGRRGKMFFET